MSYSKQTWADGDIITANKLNHIEDGIADSGSELCLINVSYNNDELIIDKTYEEIAQADSDGKVLSLFSNGVLIPLVTKGEEGYQFRSLLPIATTYHGVEVADINVFVAPNELYDFSVFEGLEINTTEIFVQYITATIVNGTVTTCSYNSIDFASFFSNRNDIVCYLDVTNDGDHKIMHTADYEIGFTNNNPSIVAFKYDGYSVVGEPNSDPQWRLIIG